MNEMDLSRSVWVREMGIMCEVQCGNPREAINAAQFGNCYSRVERGEIDGSGVGWSEMVRDVTWVLNETLRLLWEWEWEVMILSSESMRLRFFFWFFEGEKGGMLAYYFVLLIVRVQVRRLVGVSCGECFGCGWDKVCDLLDEGKRGKRGMGGRSGRRKTLWVDCLVTESLSLTMTYLSIWAERNRNIHKSTLSESVSEREGERETDRENICMFVR